MLRAIVIATAFGLVAPSYAQVKVITGDVEHIYGPGGEHASAFPERRLPVSDGLQESER